MARRREVGILKLGILTAALALGLAFRLRHKTS
jgi:hypothetical protein